MPKNDLEHIIISDKVQSKIITMHSGGLAKPLNKEMLNLNIILGYIMKKAMAQHKIIRKPSIGTAKLLSKDYPKHKTASACIMRQVLV